MPQTRIYPWGLRSRPTPKRWREALRLPLNGWITPKSGAETPFVGAQSRLSPVTLPPRTQIDPQRWDAYASPNGLSRSLFGFWPLTEVIILRCNRSVFVPIGDFLQRREE